MILESETSSIAKSNLDAIVIAEALVGSPAIRIKAIVSSSIIIIILNSLSFSATPLLLSWQPSQPFFLYKFHTCFCLCDVSPP